MNFKQITLDEIMTVVKNNIFHSSNNVKDIISGIIEDNSKHWLGQLKADISKASVQILGKLPEDDYVCFLANKKSELSNEGKIIVNIYEKVNKFYKTVSIKFVNPYTIKFDTSDVLTSMRLTYGSSLTPMIKPYDILKKLIKSDLQKYNIECSDLNFKLPH